VRLSISKTAKRVVTRPATTLKQGDFVDPQRIFIHAESFSWACGVLGEQRAKTKNDVWAPTMGTNVAFTLELYLKCLLEIERGIYFLGHDLKALFLELPSATQDTLRAFHDNFISDKPDFEALAKQGRKVDLETLLEAAYNVFAKFRYAYQGPDGHETLFAVGSIIPAIKGIILARFPEWDS
jgi:hypothetical protein